MYGATVFYFKIFYAVNLQKPVCSLSDALKKCGCNTNVIDSRIHCFITDTNWNKINTELYNSRSLTKEEGKTSLCSPEKCIDCDLHKMIMVSWKVGGVMSITTNLIGMFSQKKPLLCKCKSRYNAPLVLQHWKDFRNHAFMAHSGRFIYLL